MSNPVTLFVYFILTSANINIHAASFGREFSCNENIQFNTSGVWKCEEISKCNLTYTPSPLLMVNCGNHKICCPQPQPSFTQNSTVTSNVPTVKKVLSQNTSQIVLNKCYEYVNHKFHNDTMADDFIKCKRQLAANDSVLVSHGTPVDEREYPFMALLGFSENVMNHDSWLCGGTLISEQFILTAAHCTRIEQGLAVRWALLGILSRTNITTDLKGKNIFKIMERISHPAYKAPGLMDYENNDIAILKLETLVPLSPRIRPICLAHHEKMPYNAGTRVTLSGWGAPKPGEQESEFLVKTDIKILDNKVCIKQFATDQELLNGFDNDTMICAGDLEGDRDSCGGDSGGPILIQLSDITQCGYLQVGIIARGPWDCGNHKAAIYTRVSYYLPWIQSIIWPA